MTEQAASVAEKGGKKPLLSVRGVTKRFGRLEALSKIDMDLEEGNTLALIGPNGSGKTTFINVVSGLLRPEHGTIMFNGTDIVGLRPYKISHMGINRTFQIPHPFRSLTVLENVEVSVRFGSKSRDYEIEKRAEELIKFASLTEVEDHVSEELNTAQMKMLDLAKALATNPKLLLIDELAAGLNPTEMNDLAKKVNEIKERGISVLVVEHVMDFIKKITKHVIVMDAGTKVFDGDFSNAVNDEKVREIYFGR